MTRHRHRYHSGRLPSCFRPTSLDSDETSPPLPPSLTQPSSTATPNLTTSIYHTRLGIFALTWSRTLLGRSLRLHLYPDTSYLHSLPSSPSTLSPSTVFLTLKPFVFWNKQGSKKLPTNTSGTLPATVFWDFTRAKFGSSPEPESGFYIAVLSSVHGSLALLLGDSDQKAHSKTKTSPNRSEPLCSSYCPSGQSLVVRREHVQGAAKLHRTKVHLGGKSRSITIECEEDSLDPGLIITVDSNIVVQVKHLKWKFRGSERVEIDGYPIQISWDVHNWLFSHLDGVCINNIDQENGSFGLFTFRFEKRAADGVDLDVISGGAVEEERLFWSDELSGLEENRRMSRKKKKKKRSRNGLVGRKTRSSSSSSVSSASSSAACGSVLEWESVEESELKGGDGPTAFSLFVYAWKS